jgi:2-oxo-4-hydroxy-4-carboxy--5-ureidoimidazoline (OHCU) decarboxylase
MMDTRQTIHAIHTMSQFGGNFERHLAAACLAADPDNRQRLLDAFPSIEAKYGPAADFTESISDEDDSIGSRRRVVHLPAVVEQGNACDAWI